MKLGIMVGLVDALRAAEDGQAAGEALLQALCAQVQQDLTAAQEEGGPLRATLHWRPEGSYRALVHRELDAARALSAEALVASSSAWEAVQRAAGPRVLDLDGDWAEAGVAAQAGACPSAESTRARLARRDTTHLLALPLRGPGRRVLGMVTVELRCPDAAGGHLRWEGEAQEQAQRLVDLAGTALGSLPASARAQPGQSAAMAEVMRVLEAFAPSSQPLLLTGPSGSGKTFLARWVHTRAGRPGAFREANLRAPYAQVSLTELFGVKRGAYTGADFDREGLVVEAADGTLLLDDVDATPLEAQAALLRLVDERVYRPLGSTADREARVRVVATTHKDLWAEVRAGRFREDLYHRLSALSVRVPGLAERGAELEALAQALLRRVVEEEGGGCAAALTPGALAALHRPWPGELRGLKGALSAAALLALAEARAEGPRWPERLVVQERHLRLPAEAGVLSGLLRAAGALLDAPSLRGTLELEDAEALRGALVAAALERHGDPAAAARALGMGHKLSNGNHLKSMRRAAAHLQDLAARLGEPAPESLARLGGGE